LLLERRTVLDRRPRIGIHGRTRLVNPVRLDTIGLNPVRLDAIGLNLIRLDTIGLDPIRFDAIGLVGLWRPIIRERPAGCLIVAVRAIGHGCAATAAHGRGAIETRSLRRRQGTLL
jgi:hypothetical protein